MSNAPDTVLTQDVNDKLSYVFNWTDWLGTANISASTFTISLGDGLLTKDNEATITGNKKTTLRLSAGTLNKKYKITNKITTDESPAQEKERSFFLKIANQ